MLKKIPVKPAVQDLEKEQQLAANEEKLESPTAKKSEEKLVKVPARNSEEKFVFHKVENGDTLWSIAKKYAGNTVENIRMLNGLKENESIKTGMVLKLQKKG